MKNKRLAVGIISTVAIGMIAYIVTNKKITRKKIQKRRARVSDEGYETAYDVLYPLKDKRWKGF